LFSGNSTGDVNGKFVFSQVLMECLLRLKSTKDDTNELIKHCKKVYEGNGFELSNINEFQKQYSSDKAVWWYTRDTFFFKTLNAVLRAENIHMTFLFRTYIADIQRQLKKHQVKGLVHVYRGQLMSKNELEKLQKSCGQFISINSFFSTSTDEEAARSFLDVPRIPDNLERVLIEIDADSKVATTKPFADIRSFSEYLGESEMLFMNGSIFRLNSIKRSKNDQLWTTIQMTLCSENDSDLKNVLMHMKQDLGSGETNLRTLGNALWAMGIFDLAEFYLIRLLNGLPPQHHLLGDIYEDLAKIAGLMHAYDKSIAYREQALKYKSSNSSIDKIYPNEDLKQASE
jgi:tetratricopeptide (TPR) repeat protein